MKPRVGGGRKNLKFAFLKEEIRRLRVDKKVERWLAKGSTNLNQSTSKSI